MQRNPQKVQSQKELTLEVLGHDKKHFFTLPLRSQLTYPTPQLLLLLLSPFSISSFPACDSTVAAISTGGTLTNPQATSRPPTRHVSQERCWTPRTVFWK